MNPVICTTRPIIIIISYTTTLPSLLLSPHHHRIVQAPIQLSPTCTSLLPAGAIQTQHCGFLAEQDWELGDEGKETRALVAC